MRLLNAVHFIKDHTDVDGSKLIHSLPGIYPNGIVTDVFIGGTMTFDGVQSMRMRGAGGPAGSVFGAAYFRVDEIDKALGSATPTITSGVPFIMHAIANHVQCGIPAVFGTMYIEIAADPTSGTFTGTILAFDRFGITSRYK